MKIYNINNYSSYKNNTKSQNIHFRGSSKSEENIDSILSQLIEDNHSSAYNTNYKPIEYEKIALIHSKPMVLPSMRFTTYKDTFRDKELHNDNYDIKYYIRPEKYSIDDIPISENLWMEYTKNYEKNLSNINTNLMPGEVINNDAVYHPWITKEIREEQEKEYNYKINAQSKIWRVPKTKHETVKEIFNSSTLLSNGEMKINQNLCNLAIRLYHNSQEWSTTERSIMKALKIPFYQSIYVDYSRKKYDVVLNGLLLEYKNEDILDILNKHFKGYKYNLDSIFSEEELKDLIDKINN